MEQEIMKRHSNNQATAQNNKLEFKDKNKSQKNIIWLNPLFSKSLSTKIVHYFLKLLDKPKKS